MNYTLPSDFKARPMAILGAGTLGRRIALMLATQGAEVRIFDKSETALEQAKKYIGQELPSLVEKTPGASEGTIRPMTDLADAVRDCWLVVEALPEKLELKKDIFRQLDQLAPRDAILASNSSSYPSSQFIDHVSPEGRKRVANTHFYMPPGLNALDVMTCGETDPGVIEALMKQLPTYGLIPFHVLKESIGFIFNRIWAAIKRESLLVVATGVSTPADVDQMFKIVMGSTTAPFQLMDQVGLDVVLDIEKHYAQVNPNLPIEPRTLLEQYVSKGKLGVKTGSGFYDYPQK
ncbi:3-hydroxyacyl-CoA dehydrogenase family protein [Edaphobacter sp. DSM 109919]|uniref:3-hydroxyacyl-CoA dehydrogenase family protein n=1 Tax=Edaphobacter paludis TaxID=3035702 RepID=A0AAU7CVX2_9BACT